MVGNKVFQSFISQSADGAAQNVFIKKEWCHDNARVGLLIIYDYLRLVLTITPYLLSRTMFGLEWDYLLVMITLY